MIPKPLDAIEASDIQALIDANEAERKTLEYKQQLPGEAPSDKDKLRKTATSLANTAGGDVVFGIAESDEGLLLHGIEDVGEDDALRRILDALQYNIEPKLPPPPHKLVTMPDGKRVLVVRIARSWRGPHFSKNDMNYRMYGRHSKGRFPMDASEMRQAIMASDEVPERIRQWRQQRVDSLLRRHTPVEIAHGPFMALHLVPLASFDDPLRFSATDLSNHRIASRLLLPNMRDLVQRINIDGFLQYDTDTKAYTQVYRSGRVESVFETESFLVRQTLTSTYEHTVLTTLDSQLTALEELGVSGPIAIMLTLAHVHGAQMDYGPRNKLFNPPIDRDHLVLPDVLVDRWPADLFTVMKPVFDGVWNACGRPQSLNYNGDGTWRGGYVPGYSDRLAGNPS